MSIIKSIGDRIMNAVAEAPAPVAAFLPKNWRRTRDIIDQQISSAQARRRTYIAERDAFVMEGVEGNEEARKEAEKCDRSVDDIDRELSRLHVARSRAADHVAAEDAVEAARLEEERIADIVAKVEAWHDSAKDVDKAIGVLLTRLGELKAHGNGLWLVIPHSEFAQHIATLNSAVATLTDARLAESGFAFRTKGFIDDKRVHSRLHDAAYLVSLAKQKQG